MNMRDWWNAPAIQMLEEIKQIVVLILKEIKIMADTIADLNTAITGEGANVQIIVNALPAFATLANKIVADIQTLLSEVQAGSPDLTSQVTGINAQAGALSNAATQLQQIASQLTAADATIPVTGTGTTSGS